MRRIPLTSAVLVVLGLTAAGLAGCSAGGSGACPRPAADASVADLVTVTGEFGDAPDVEVYAPFHVDESSAFDIETGDGAALTTDEQLVLLDFTILGGDDGRTLVQSPYEPGVQAFPLAQLAQSIPALTDALHCARAGSRTVVAIAPDGIQPEAASGIGLAENESAVAVFDLRTVFLAKAEGSNVFNAGFGMPTVVRAPDGRPGVVVPESAPPADVAAQTLIRGDGAVVKADDTVRVNYLGVVWGERTVFNSTWESGPGGGPAPVSLALAADPVFSDALAGQTLGSQVMVVVPPDQAYGDQEQENIPANSTLVFVIDILGIDAPPA